MNREELESKKQELRQQMNKLHDQIVPIDTELKRLVKHYESLSKQYYNVDFQLAKLDGRYKKCRPFSSSKKPQPPKDPIESLSKAQLDMLIHRLEAELKAKQG